MAKHIWLALLCVLGLSACSRPWERASHPLLTPAVYLADRGQDLLDCVGLCVTVTDRPQVAMHMCMLSLISFGYGDIDGMELGDENGRVGWLKCQHNCSHLTVFGRRYFPAEAPPQSCPVRNPNSDVTEPIVPTTDVATASGGTACIHILHLGYVGLKLNLYYADLIDFPLGFFLLDPEHDDGQPRGIKSCAMCK